MQQTHKKKIYLASKSPRRQSLLKQVGIEYELLDCEIDESVNNNELALNYVRRMSIEKAKEGWRSKNRIGNYPVLAADTSLVFENSILGKPIDRDNAKEMLKRLAGKEHEVITSVSLIYQVNEKNLPEKTRVDSITSVTQVKFSQLTEEIIKEYLQTNEWTDKAGSYGIQGYFAKYIETIHGSYSGVVGLPLYETNQLICGAFKTINRVL